jgi:hypothetical protein
LTFDRKQPIWYNYQRGILLEVFTMNNGSGADCAVRSLIDSVAEICLNPRFEPLFNELIALYSDDGIENPRVSAFKDAYYAILHESDTAGSVVRALPSGVKTLTGIQQPRN